MIKKEIRDYNKKELKEKVIKKLNKLKAKEILYILNEIIIIQNTGKIKDTY